MHTLTLGTTSLGRSEDNFRELVLSFHVVSEEESACFFTAYSRPAGLTPDSRDSASHLTTAVWESEMRPPHPALFIDPRGQTQARLEGQVPLAIEPSPSPIFESQEPKGACAITATY